MGSSSSGIDEMCGSTFWDVNVTWNTETPRFSSCFEKTVLIWIPCLFLWLVAPLQTYSAVISKNGAIPWSIFNVLKLICSTILMILQITELGYQIDRDNDSSSEVFFNDFLAPSILIITIFLQTVFVVLDKRKGVQSSGFIFMFWFLMTVCGFFQYRSYFSDYREDFVDLTPFVVYNIFYPFVIIMTILNCFADVRPSYLSYPRGPKASPVLDASFPSRLLFTWITPLVWLGFRHPVEYEELYDLIEENTSEHVVHRWNTNWEKSIEQAKSKKRKTKTVAEYSKAYDDVDVMVDEGESPYVSVLPTMIKTFGVEFFTGTIMKITYDVLQFVSPIVLHLLIEFTEDDSIETWKGYFYAAVLFCTTLFMSLLLGQVNIKMYTVGARVRTGITASVYRKALKISNSARKESTVGEIVNLMAVDSQRFMDLTTYLNLAFSAPLTIALSIFGLYIVLGPSSMAGLTTLLILIPTNGFIASKMKKLQVKQMAYKDKRVKMMNEILNGMKVLKLYAWEPSFEKQVLELRKKEIKVLRKTAYYNAVMSFFFSCTPFLVTLTTFITYVYTSPDHILTSDRIFVTINLINILRFPLFMIPFLVVSGVQTSVSLKRLNKFLNADELDPNAVTRDSKITEDVIIKNGTFSWGKSKEDKNILTDININVKPGSLVAVVGTVGSGKTSLCSALLGDMEKRAGDVNVKDKIAYVPQQAWIQNSILKDNILFGKEFDESFYKKTLQACSLEDDIAMLPGGDQTEIGEKGINLSGGQKQRVSLARAVYSQSPIYLLDDPLSAVDSHVGKHIFNHVISNDGMLANKTRILVTHGLTYLPAVDHVIVMKDGKISEQGSYKQLVANKGAFQEFLLQYLAEVEEEDIDIDEDITVLKAELENFVDAPILKRAISRNKSENNGSIASVGSVRRRNKQQAPAFPKSAAAVDTVGQKLIEAEKSQTGKVSWSVYIYYIRSVGALIMILTMLAYVLSQSCAVMANLWLTKWSDDANSTEASVRDTYIGVYGALGIGQALFVMTATLMMARGTVVASWDLNKGMLANVLRSPMSFFDMTPLGRIVNRFSKDLDTIDTLLPMNLRTYMQILIIVIATFCVIVGATPIFMAVLVPCIILYYILQVVYVTSSRQLKRIESVTRSPIYSHFGETVQGTSTIRAYGKETEFILDSEKKVDTNQQCYIPSFTANRWLSVRLELIGNILTMSACIFAVLARSSDISSGVVGLSITYAQSVTQLLYMLVRMASDVETNIVSVERIKEYCETPTEAAWEIKDKKPQKNWPEEGEVVFSKFATRYREGLDLVVQDIDCTFKSGEKVGIVGRTGAGKSSMTLALFRIIESAAGHIIIDGVDIATIGLHDLRSRLTIIPQDPVLFSGSLRINLDPFEHYSDDAVWSAIEQAHLKPFVKGLSEGLQHEVNEGGENFSVGQRQLVCLARALLRKTRVLILDEATAAVDLETDDLIQKTIREQFSSCTVITIAHRLNTIMDSDRILVLDKGVIKEFAPPKTLLDDASSIFYGMAKDAGLV